jgi:hypothetical protein
MIRETRIATSVIFATTADEAEELWVAFQSVEIGSAAQHFWRKAMRNGLFDQILGGNQPQWRGLYTSEP